MRRLLLRGWSANNTVAESLFGGGDGIGIPPTGTGAVLGNTAGPGPGGPAVGGGGGGGGV